MAKRKAAGNAFAVPLKEPDADLSGELPAEPPEGLTPDEHELLRVAYRILFGGKRPQELLRRNDLNDVLDRYVNLQATITGVAMMWMRQVITKLATKHLKETGESTVEAKRALVRVLNDLLREWDMAFKTDRSDDPCILLVVADDYGGKYVVSNTVTKKRTDTTRSIEEVLGKLSLMPRRITSADPVQY